MMMHDIQHTVSEDTSKKLYLLWRKNYKEPFLDLFRRSDSSSSSAESSESTSDSSTGDSSSESTQPSEDNDGGNDNGNSSAGGNYTTMSFESTAYSYAEAGASYFTASGTDLRTNPQAVAVDPSVIPLGTLVEVEGYGLAVALDTGGAIKGRIIDVHFDNVPACERWGRRQVQVKIYR